MQSRILVSSSVDKDELMIDVVDETMLEDGETGAPAPAFLDLTSPSAKTQERFMPAFSHAWNRQNWQFLRVLRVITHWPPLLHL